MSSTSSILLLRHLRNTARNANKPWKKESIRCWSSIQSYGATNTLPSSVSKNEKMRMFPYTTNHWNTIAQMSTTSSDKEITETSSAAEEQESMEFRAETRQLLDIVTHSLYTDKQVFLRELVSNASDALEKLRHVQSANEEGVIDSDVPLEIRIETDEMNKTLTISDTGIGMTRDDMISHLGTIARSGSKAFIQQMKEMKGSPGDDSAERGIIGKFGVGFYSAFMVRDHVEVRSRSALQKHSEDTPKLWSSHGTGSFQIADLSSEIRQNRGSSIVIHLKDDCQTFCEEKTIQDTLRKYSNFVNFPIFLNGKRVNTVQALWTNDPKSVSKESYIEFYKFIGNAYDEPIYHLHFHADAPIDIHSLFFVPSFHTERGGMERMKSGVSLYSRKVLIEQKCPDIVPDWMRFIKGVVDSEDLPLSISREKPQDSALIQKIRKVLTRKFISFLANKAKKDPSEYKQEFYNEYSFFLKEGICQDFEFQEPLSKLMYWETSKTMNKELSSFDEYISRCKPSQKEIYYLCAPNRNVALDSPYLEEFQNAGIEVIFVYSAIDEFVMSSLEKYQGRKLITIEKGDIDLGLDGKDKDKSSKDKSDEESTDPVLSKNLSEKEINDFCTWYKGVLHDKVETCRVTKRGLTSTPALITDHESGELRRMMRYVDTQGEGDLPELPKQTIEINPRHPTVIGLYSIKDTEPDLAKVVASQIFDNCLVAAGLMDDGRTMLPRLNDILLSAVKGAVVLHEKDDGVTDAEVVTEEEGEAVVLKGDGVVDAEVVKEEEGEAAVKDDITQNKVDDKEGVSNSEETGGNTNEQKSRK